MTQTKKYSSEWVSAYYDSYAEKEWNRFSQSAADRLSLSIHNHYLRQFAKPGSRVLEVGAGPGRFTMTLAELGCRVVVADISDVQLNLHRKYASELDFESAVENRLCLDVCDMGVLDTESFDLVLCYGGPISYVFDQAEVALQECVRVCRPRGLLLFGVMSLWGAVHSFLSGVLEVPVGSNQKITETGDLTPENWEETNHRCHMFRAAEFQDLATEVGIRILKMSASNCISTNHDDCLAGLDDESEEWKELLRMELEACQEPGCLDMGTHIILIGEKP
jgi:ubiquinone/menaquinone biosynthesis C-methylase UbiE